MAQKNTLSRSAPSRRAGRFSMGATVPADDIGGIVGVGEDKNGDALVYVLGHTTASVPIHAVAVALSTEKVIPADDIARLFAEAGRLDALAKAVEKATPK